MRLAHITAMAALAVSAIAGTASAAAPVRAFESRTVAVRGVQAGVIKASQLRAAKRVGDTDSLLGLPVILVVLGGIAATAAVVAVADSGGSN